MDGQSHGAMGIAKLATGHEHERTAIHRINHIVPYNTYKMDDWRLIQDLKGLGYSLARDRHPCARSGVLKEPAEAFEPVYVLDTATKS